MVNIAFTGGGTGGHIYPGLAVAAELKNLLANSPQTQSNFRVFWIGSSVGMDRSLVEDAGIEFFGVPSGRLRRYFSLKTLADFFRVIAGFFAARKILKKEKASLLFSKGGFVSVPPCAAASSLRIPVFTHESDFSPGLATKLNARFVRRTGGKIFTAYNDTEKFFKKKYRSFVTVSGNPVRAGFRTADPKKGRAFLGLGDHARILLVLGGSQGAKEINDLIYAALPGLTEVYTVVHQTGMNIKSPPLAARDIERNEKYKPYPYIKEEMAVVMSAAELILGRSGAGIWEWAVCGKPMILIPLRGSGTRGDQVENAEFFEKAGAAQILTGEDANPESLANAVNSLARNTEKRNEMASASAKIGASDASVLIARTLAERIANEL